MARNLNIETDFEVELHIDTKLEMIPELNIETKAEPKMKTEKLETELYLDLRGLSVTISTLNH